MYTFSSPCDYRYKDPLGPTVPDRIPVRLHHLHGLLHSGPHVTRWGLWWQWQEPGEYKVSTAHIHVTLYQMLGILHEALSWDLGWSICWYYSKRVYVNPPGANPGNSPRKWKLFPPCLVFSSLIQYRDGFPSVSIMWLDGVSCLMYLASYWSVAEDFEPHKFTLTQDTVCVLTHSQIMIPCCLKTEGHPCFSR